MVVNKRQLFEDKERLTFKAIKIFFITTFISVSFYLLLAKFMQCNE